MAFSDSTKPQSLHTDSPDSGSAIWRPFLHTEHLIETGIYYNEQYIGTEDVNLHVHAYYINDVWTFQLNEAEFSDAHQQSSAALSVLRSIPTGSILICAIV
ncbi:MAG TPA: hypothetical protein VJ695_10005 [Nitrososphaera sp.]|nr:hypothetical protein [Nitrososphaera sp.]